MRALPDMPEVTWEETADVARVVGIEHDVRPLPGNPAGILHFLAREGGFRAVRFTEIERISGLLGAQEARQTVTEILKEEKAERRTQRRAERRARRAK